MEFHVRHCAEGEEPRVCSQLNSLCVEGLNRRIHFAVMLSVIPASILLSILDIFSQNTSHVRTASICCPLMLADRSPTSLRTVQGRVP